MARKTAAERRAEEEAATAAALAKRVEFLKTLPQRLFELQKLAEVVGAEAEPVLLKNGFALRVSGDYNEVYLNTWDTEEWEVAHMERQLQEKREEQEAAVTRREMAQKALNKLSAEELAALKEFQSDLKF